MPDSSQLAQLMQLAQSAGVPSSGGGDVVPYPQAAAAAQDAQPAQSTSPQQPMRWQQALGKYAPYALMGAAGSQGGAGGTAMAAGVAALMAYLKQKGKHAPDFLGGMKSGDPRIMYSMPGASGLDEEMRKGGGVKNQFTGKPSTKLATRPTYKSGGGGIEAVHAVNATRQLERVPRIGTSIPHAAPFRARATGRFAKGGLIRGMGAAERGKGFSGEF